MGGCNLKFKKILLDCFLCFAQNFGEKFPFLAGLLCLLHLISNISLFGLEGNFPLSPPFSGSAIFYSDYQGFRLLVAQHHKGVDSHECKYYYTWHFHFTRGKVPNYCHSSAKFWLLFFLLNQLIKFLKYSSIAIFANVYAEKIGGQDGKNFTLL